MKPTALVLIVVLLGSSVTFAHPPCWYVGGSLQGNAVGEEPRLRPSDDTPTPGHIYAGLGIEGEGGIAGDFWDVYLGYRQDLSRHTIETPYSEVDNRWTAERLLFGARIHVSDDYANPVKPLIGAGITYGWARRHLESAYLVECYTESSAETSRGTLGWLAEAGFLVKVHRQWFVSFMMHFETLNIQFGDQSRYGSIKNVRQGSAQIGIKYEFNRAVW